MKTYVPVAPLSGLLTPFVGKEVYAGLVLVNSTLISFQPAVTDAPTTGSVDLELNGPSATLLASESIPAFFNRVAIPGTLSVPIAAGTELTVLIVSAANALGLYGNIVLEDPSWTIAVALDLCTFQEVSDHAGGINVANQTLVEDLIHGVSAGMQKDMRRQFVVNSEVEKIDSVGDTMLTLRDPLLSVGSVKLAGELIDAADYEVDLLNSQLHHVDSSGSVIPWARGIRNHEVDFDFGYSAIPFDVNLAAIKQTRHEFHQTQPAGNRLGSTGMTIPAGGQMTWERDGWLPSVQIVLDLYRKTSQF